MIAVDTSVVVPALIEWHEQHQVALEAVADAVIPGHAYLESYSVLTRMPGGVDRHIAREVLSRRFPPERVLGLGSMTHDGIVDQSVAAEIDGGSTYDALIALIAHDNGYPLATRDRRAARTYEAVGVDVIWVGE